ncbi:DUF4118 domain-containing protein [Phytoactinopolyspora limicola]|uniref:DUF4118 domain-containing protein n=1 Tax=Phytoactinopolyspora limicola TaxID=2715536 RepID=UPI00140DAC1A|nr:DUF4118 domain-containing protein [Phytoactinopolyspora limicola]
MARGQLRIYLGAAPGVGKTFAMLGEAHRRKERGTDVVIGFVETHGRAKTAAMIGELEVVPRATLSYRSAEFEEMDVAAVLTRRPEVVLVDELAHTNVPGSRHTKRWQDIDELLDAGITVLSTVNIQHMESLNDVVERITGITQRETVPDAWVRNADQIEIVDMTPEALRRRMSHGNIYGPDKINAALTNYFRVGNLTALRELALLWLAGKVDEQLDRHRSEHGVATPWEARERVVVALTGGPEGETLIRRAARIAERSKGADLMAVHVAGGDGLVGANPVLLERQRVLVEDLGGTFHQVLGDDVPTALIDFARGVNATQLVLGASRRGQLAHLFSPGVGVTATALSGPIDVHLVTHEEAGKGRRRGAAGSALSAHRRFVGYILTVVGLAAVTLGLPRNEDSFPSGVLLVLALVTAVALTGGMVPAVVAAIGGFLLLNFFFTEPYHTFAIDRAQNVLTLIVFLVVAVSVSVVVDQAARRTREATMASTEAQTLASVAGHVLRGSRPLTALLERLREAFALTSVTLLERRPDVPAGPSRQSDPTGWTVAAHIGEPVCATPAQGDVEVSIDQDMSLALRGRSLPASDRRIIEVFAAQAALALRQERLAAAAAAAKPLAEVDRMRTALLAAVSHDLRTPLAAAKAAVTSLRSQEVQFSQEDQDELLATADQALDRLARLIANLLDMSRLQAGALGVTLTEVSLDDAVPRALDELGTAGHTVAMDFPAAVPPVRADPGLLERVLVNVIGNALRHSPAGHPPTVAASTIGDQVELNIIDHGPGVPESDRDRIFIPFQRLGDTNNDAGVGLGLALSRGLVEAMGGSLTPATTPGGGLTIRIALSPAD